MEGADAVFDGPIPDAERLTAEVARIARLQRHSRYEESSAALPGLLRVLHSAAFDAAHDLSLPGWSGSGVPASGG